MNRKLTLCLLACAALIVAALALAAPKKASPLLGRWDMTVHATGYDFPSWFEIDESSGKLGGRFVGQVGSARPIQTVSIDGDKLTFSLPPQYEGRKDDLRFTGTLKGGTLQGTTTDREGHEIRWSAVHAPSLKRTRAPRWGAPIELINGKDTTGWHPRAGDGRNWTTRDGMLVNQRSGSDIVTNQKFTDFKLHAEFRYPAESNSGIYLRGRYEAQIEDDYGRKADSHGSGGIYGFLAPSQNTVKPAGEWQTYDITLVGRTVTVALNGVTVIDKQEIPGITGGALDSAEGEPGPLFLQGDHGPIDFRKLTITPAK